MSNCLHRFCPNYDHGERDRSNTNENGIINTRQTDVPKVYVGRVEQEVNHVEGFEQSVYD